MRRLVTVAEAAKVFNVSAWTIREWCKAGTFEGAFKPPGAKSWQIPREAIEKVAQAKYGE